jgi:hypothetical protein
MTCIHHCLGAHTTIFHGYYAAHTAGLHCQLMETPGIHMPTRYVHMSTSCMDQFWVPKYLAHLVKC